MKKIILVIGMGFMGLIAFAQNGLENVIVEKYYISNADDAAASIGKLPIGSVTYRIFLDLKEGYMFQSAYGDPNHELRLETSTTFFNNEDYGGTFPNNISTSQAKSNTVMLDSWLSVGAGCKGYFGILKSEDNGSGTFVNEDDVLANADALAGIPLTAQDGLIAKTVSQTIMNVTTIGIDDILPMLDASNATTNGQIFTTNNGAWAALGGSVGPDATNKVLIAQITTDGVFTYKLNIQIGTPEDGTESYVAENPGNGELSIPSLKGSFSPVSKPVISIPSSIGTDSHKEGDIIQLTTNVTSTGTITKVEFFVDGVSVGSDNTAPYSANYTAAKGNHSLTVKVTDNYGVTESSPLAFSVTGTSSVALESNTGIISIQPNPASDYITINSGKQVSSVELFDVLGNVVIETNKQTINISSLKSGIYFVAVTIDGEKTSSKIIKR